MTIKKSIPIVVLSMVYGVGHAQSSVQLYGTVDGGTRYQTNANTTGGSVVTMNSNGYYSSNKLDFGGKEDLGGGFNAHFLLEGGFNVGNGAYDNTTGTEFNRQSYVGLGSKYGSVDLGRQYTIAHDIVAVYDPFGFHFTPLIPLTTASDGTRFNNDAKYKGEFGPVRVEVDNAFGGTAGNFSSGASRGAGLTYSSGPFSIGGLYSHRNFLVGTSYQGDRYYMAGAAYRVGPLRFSGGYMSETQDVITGQSLVTRNVFGGVRYRMTSTLTLTGAYYQTNVNTDKASRRGLSVLALAYALSKRTVLYAEADYTRYKNATVSTLNTSGKQSQTGVTVGIDHLF